MQILIATLLGMAVGHTVDLGFPRLYTDEPFRGPFYRCGTCRARFRGIYTVPVLGFVVRRGRCPDCGSKLPLRALALPLGAATLFACSMLVFEDFGLGLLGGVFATVFLMLAVADIERRLLPNRIIYPSLLVAIGMSWAWPDASVTEILAGGLAATGIGIAMKAVSLPFGAEAFGMGDIKTMILMGFVVGLPAVLVGIFIGMIAAAVFGGLLVLLRLRSRRDYIPHGPFLALGAVVALFWGIDIWGAYTG